MAMSKEREAIPESGADARFDQPSRPIAPARPPGSPPRMNTDSHRPFPFFVEVLAPPFDQSDLRRTAGFSDEKWLSAAGTDWGAWKREVSYASFEVDGDIVVQAKLFDGPPQGMLILDPIDSSRPDLGDSVAVMALLGKTIIVRNLASEATFNVRAELEILLLSYKLFSSAAQLDAWTNVTLSVGFGLGGSSDELELHRLSAPPVGQGSAAPAQTSVLLEVSGKVPPAAPVVNVSLAAQLFVQRRYPPPPANPPTSDVWLGGFGDRQPIARLNRIVVEGY